MDCSICLDIIKGKSIKLNCNHVFHKDCFDKYLNHILDEEPNNNKVSCPNCRENITITNNDNMNNLIKKINEKEIIDYNNIYRLNLINRYTDLLNNLSNTLDNTLDNIYQREEYIWRRNIQPRYNNQNSRMITYETIYETSYYRTYNGTTRAYTNAYERPIYFLEYRPIPNPSLYLIYNNIILNNDIIIAHNKRKRNNIRTREIIKYNKYEKNKNKNKNYKNNNYKNNNYKNNNYKNKSFNYTNYNIRR